jgi:RNA polymerase sigma-70 factor (ECF subfamily)
VARNIALNRRREQPGPTLSLEELADFIPAPCSLDDLDARELGRSINRFLGTLTRKNRNLFLRRYWFGDSVKELAAAFSMTENAVSVRLSRIRDKLRDFLIKEGQYEA